MIKVALVTSWGDRCGISEYAAKVIKYAVDPEIQIEVVPLSIAGISAEEKHYDIIHINESGYAMGGFHQSQLDTMRAKGRKLLLTCHASHPVNSKNSLTILFDHVVTHEVGAEDGFHFIPQGTPLYEPKEDIGVTNYLGTSGFPLPWKNLQALATACQAAHFSLLAMLPLSGHADAEKVKQEILYFNPTAVVDTSWKTDEEIMDALRSCTASCFPYVNHNPGPSAAANYGISVRRPIIVSRCHQFSHLKGHEDEVYFIESMSPSAAEIADVLFQVREDIEKHQERIPNKLYEQLRWDKCGQEYVKLYKEICS